MTKGSCLCGTIAFEIDPAGVVTSVGCFCSNCRKVAGSQYGVYLQLKPGSFRWISGEDQVLSYESSPGNKRGFCRTCGCVAPILTGYGAMRVPGGALDDDPGIAPNVLIYTQSRAGWCAVDAASESFADAGPAEFWGGVMVKLYGAS